MTQAHPEHGHADVHKHDHDDAHRQGDRGFTGALRALVAPHHHDTAGSLDDALTASRAGMRALTMSLAVLGATAILQALAFVVSGSVSLLADTIHNFSDALTAIPLGVAFWLGRRGPTRRYTYGYGRAEDIAGVFVVLVIVVSAAVAASEAVLRLLHPHHISHIGWVVGAGIIGFVGNELAARIRVHTGRRIGSAALVADGLHARTDAFASLAVVLGALGVLAGWPPADPLVGLLISVVILRVLLQAARDIYRRLMDSVDPRLVDQIEQVLVAARGVQRVDSIRLRWIGHDLHAEAEIVSDAHLSLLQAHEVAEEARHALLHAVARLTGVILHSSPSSEGGGDPHATTAHHFEANIIT